MRHSFRHGRFVNGIKAFNQRDLVRALRILEIPAMRLIRLYRKRLPTSGRVDEAHPDEIRFGNGMGIGDGEGVFVDGFDGSPDLFYPLVSKNKT